MSTSWTAPQTLGGLLVGSIALVAFAIVELRAPAPLLELRVFRAVDFSLAIVVQWVGQVALFGALFLLPLFLQEARGYGAFATGLSLLPQALAAALFMPIGGALFDRIGARPLVIVGLGLVAAATVVLAHVSTSTHGTDLIVPLAMTGAGMGLMMMPLNTHLINAAPRQLVSRVTSLTNALQQVITSLAVAGLATILTARATAHLTAATVAVAAHHPRPATASTLPHRVGAPMAHTLHALLNGAFVAAFQDTFLLLVIAALIGAVLGLVLWRSAVAPQTAAVAVVTDALCDEEEIPEARLLAG